MNKWFILWLLFGLGNSLQVVASLSFSELFVLVSAPILLLRGELFHMRRTGSWTLFSFALLPVLGCFVNYLVFGSHPAIALRRFAQVSIFLLAPVTGHWLLRNKLDGFKWWLVGAAISSVLCTFVFQRSVDIVMYHGNATEIMNGPIFWITRAKGFVMLPTTGWYLRTPLIYSVLMPLGFAVFSLFTSASGRSASLCAVGFCALVILAGKNYKRFINFRSRFWVLLLAAMILIPLANLTYRGLAISGALGELAQKKYESQSQGETSIARLIIGGRAESIVGLYACVFHPILGFGLEGSDPDGYVEDFYYRFGTYEDIRHIIETREYLNRYGITIADLGIPTHSYVAAFWVYYGILGLIYILYLLFVFCRYIYDDVGGVPQWYGWIVCSMPALFWDIFFSPVSNRVGIPLVAVACLVGRAIRQRKMALPRNMQLEIMEEMKCARC